jgi:two-component system response regulator PilR (NtrC family)
MARILVVDDDLSVLEFLEAMLAKERYSVSCADDGVKAIEMLKKRSYDLLLCDIRMGKISGLEVLKKAKELYPNIVVIMISAFATTETAVEAVRLGAYDYIPKPFKAEELSHTIRYALETKTPGQEKGLLERESKQTVHFGNIVGNSPKMQKIYTLIRQVAKTKTNVLISGESGTGKELIANAIHNNSDRRDRPFVVINCGGIPETLMASELCGHKKGAFTGAIDNKRGLFEVADGGTVFLDEIGELTPPIQIKLLRLVQEKVFKRVGDTEDIRVNIRIISATNKDLEKEVMEGRFREDLYYRLNVIHINAPPLRERPGDLPLLAQHFLEKYAREIGKEINKLSSYALDMLSRYDFPGNIRELENMIERSVALSTTNIILPESITLSTFKRHAKAQNSFVDINIPLSGFNLTATLDNMETKYIKRALEITNGSKKRAAEVLGINLRSLRYRIKKLKME